LPLLLTLLLLGKLAGETTVNGIIEWIKERQDWVRTQLNWPKRFPVNSTYSEALARCDAEQIVTVLAQVILKARAVEQCGSEPSRLQARQQEDPLTHVAMDGKTLRGTLGHTAEGQPQCICWASMSIKVGLCWLTALLPVKKTRSAQQQLCFILHW